MQLSFPIKQNPQYFTFQELLKLHGIIQPSIIYKAYILAHGFNGDIEIFDKFITQIKETYAFKRLSNNHPRQLAYLSSILFNEIRSIEEAIKTDKLVC